MKRLSDLDDAAIISAAATHYHTEHENGLDVVPSQCEVRRGDRVRVRLADSDDATIAIYIVGSHSFGPWRAT